MENFRQHATPLESSLLSTLPLSLPPKGEATKEESSDSPNQDF